MYVCNVRKYLLEVKIVFEHSIKQNNEKKYHRFHKMYTTFHNTDWFLSS